jgi:acetyl esterase/lipase
MAEQDPLYLPKAPPLDPAWLRFEAESGIANPQPAIPILERQPLYEAECRALTARMTSPGARDEHLSRGITVSSFTVPSSLDTFPIPVLQYSPSPSTGVAGGESTTTIIYIHGGGLVVGAADSEELTCRRIVASSALPSPPTVYSIGYRLMPLYPASVCLSDCLSAFTSILSRGPASTTQSKVLVIGSSSGGQLAALLAGRVGRSKIDGLALRCPVTSDAFTSLTQYVPDRFRALHTSTLDDTFVNSLLGKMVRDVPRDGLGYMPLEASPEELKGMPRKTWVQVCTNDGLYSDGVCYARALGEVGVEVRVDVVWGWPHTFWLKAPGLERSLEAEGEMSRGLRWLAE